MCSIQCSAQKGNSRPGHVQFLVVCCFKLHAGELSERNVTENRFQFGWAIKGTPVVISITIPRYALKPPLGRGLSLAELGLHSSHTLPKITYTTITSTCLYFHVVVHLAPAFPFRVTIRLPRPSLPGPEMALLFNTYSQLPCSSNSWTENYPFEKRKRNPKIETPDGKIHCRFVRPYL